MTVITQGVHPVLIPVVLGRLSDLIATAVGMNTFHEGVEVTVPSYITDAEMIALVRGFTPMNLMTLGGTIREVRDVGVDTPVIRGSADEVLVPSTTLRSVRE